MSALAVVGTRQQLLPRRRRSSGAHARSPASSQRSWLRELLPEPTTARRYARLDGRARAVLRRHRRVGAPAARRGLPALLVRARRRAAAVRLRRGHAAPAAAQRRAAGPRRDLPHPPPRRSLARACPACSRRSTCAGARSRSTSSARPARSGCCVAVRRLGPRRATTCRSPTSTPATRSSSTATRSRRSTCATAAARSATRSSSTSGPGASIPSAREALGVEPGPAFGRLQAGETVDGVSPEQVIGEARPGRRVVLSGDTAPCDMVRESARGADVLVHEATFLDEDAGRAAETEHSTARQAAEVAREAGRRAARAHASLEPLPAAARARGGRRTPSSACTSRATSTPSRCRRPRRVQPQRRAVGSRC